MLESDDMISNLTIKDFRTFPELKVEPLTRVNLFVGTNNAGKTTILEAVELLATGTFSALASSLRRRGEEILGPDGTELDPSHLFHGHLLGTSFSLHGEGEVARWVHCGVAFDEPVENSETSSPEGLVIDLEGNLLALRFRSHLFPEPRRIRLTALRNIRLRSLLLSPPLDSGMRVNFLGTADLNSYDSGKLWDRIVLTPQEEGVAAALRIIEPRIDRIAFVGEGRRANRSIFLKLSGSDQRMPLGSVGDGLKRLLNLTLNLFSAKDGFLLVDEIDTGLHYSVMMDMWKLVIETARQLEVQVFATTHSLDCVRALARVRDRFPELAPEVTLHRVQKNMPATVTYDMDEIAIAARDHIEVR